MPREFTNVVIERVSIPPLPTPKDLLQIDPEPSDAVTPPKGVRLPKQ